MNLLKQSAAVTIRLGPYLDKTTGVDEETGITPVVEVSKNHAAFAARNSATAITHDSNGWFAVELDATDTGTLGPMTVKSDDAATFLPVWREFLVVPANVYDSLVGGSDKLQVDLQEWIGTAPNVLIASRVDTSTGAMAANVMTAAAAAADLTTELQAGLATAAALATVDTVVDTIQAKTDNLPSDPADHSVVIAATDAVMARLGAPVGASHAEDAATYANLIVARVDTVGSAVDVVDNLLDTEVPALTTVLGQVKTKTDLIPAAGLPSLADYSSARAAKLDNLDAAISTRQATLDATERNAIADAFLKRDWTGLTGEAARSILNALRIIRNKWSISGTTLTVTKEDDTTTAWTATVTKTAGADPITAKDPD